MTEAKVAWPVKLLAMRTWLRNAILVVAVLSSIRSAANADATPAAVGTPSPTQMLTNALQRLASYSIPPYVVYLNDWRINFVPGNFATHSTEYCCDPRRLAIRLSDGTENESIPQPSGAPLPLAYEGAAFAGIVPFSRDPADQTLPGSKTRASITDATTLASVLLAAQTNYKVRYVGSENIAGHATYHVQLEPLSDPHKHNLRDLWTDAQTWDVWRAHFVVDYAASTLDPGPHGSQAGVLAPADFTVYFAQASNYWVVARMVWTHGIFGDITTYDVGTDDVAFPETLPDWLFDPLGYADHRRASEPDYVGLLLEGKSVPQAQSGTSPAPTATLSPPSGS